MKQFPRVIDSSFSFDNGQQIYMGQWIAYLHTILREPVIMKTSDLFGTNTRFIRAYMRD